MLQNRRQHGARPAPKRSSVTVSIVECYTIIAAVILAMREVYSHYYNIILVFCHTQRVRHAALARCEGHHCDNLRSPMI